MKKLLPKIGVLAALIILLVVVVVLDTGNDNDEGMRVASDEVVISVPHSYALFIKGNSNAGTVGEGGGSIVLNDLTDVLQPLIVAPSGRFPYITEISTADYGTLVESFNFTRNPEISELGDDEEFEKPEVPTRDNPVTQNEYEVFVEDGAIIIAATTDEATTELCAGRDDVCVETGEVVLFPAELNAAITAIDFLEGVSELTILFAVSGAVDIEQPTQFPDGIFAMGVEGVEARNFQEVYLIDEASFVNEGESLVVFSDGDPVRLQLDF